MNTYVHVTLNPNHRISLFPLQFLQCGINVCCCDLQCMKKTFPGAPCCLWPSQAKLEPVELWLAGDFWVPAGASFPVCQNVNLSPGPGARASLCPAPSPPTPAGGSVPQLQNWTLPPIPKHPPTVTSSLGQGQQAAFSPIASLKIPMSLCCCWRLGLRTCYLATCDYHGRSTCPLRWPTTSVMTSNIIKLLQCIIKLYSKFFSVYGKMHILDNSHTFYEQFWYLSQKSNKLVLVAQNWQAERYWCDLNVFLVISTQVQLVLSHFASGPHGQPSIVLAERSCLGRVVFSKRHGVHPRTRWRLQPLAERGCWGLGLRTLSAVLQESPVSRAGRKQVPLAEIYLSGSFSLF